MSLSRRRDVLLAAAALATVGPARAKSAPTLSFLALGDWGQRGSSIQRAVAGQMGRTAAQIGARFVLTVGDNFYKDGVTSTLDSHWRQSFESVYDAPALQVPWFPTLGNHDYRGAANPNAQIAYSALSRRWRMPARFYVQRVALPGGRTLDLFAIDTTLHLSAEAQHAALRAAQIAWFEPALKASKADWKLVFGHHAIFSNGSRHGSSAALIAWLKPKLEAAGVQAYICGHDHDLQHIVSGPLHYIITGGGSDPRAVKPKEKWVAGTRFAKGAAGFAAFQIAGDVMKVRWIDPLGVDLWTADIRRTRAKVVQPA